jgi:hypothetical protein
MTSFEGIMKIGHVYQLGCPSYDYCFVGARCMNLKNYAPYVFEMEFT